MFTCSRVHVFLDNSISFFLYTLLSPNFARFLFSRTFSARKLVPREICRGVVKYSGMPLCDVATLSKTTRQIAHCLRGIMGCCRYYGVLQVLRDVAGAGLTGCCRSYGMLQVLRDVAGITGITS